MQMFPHVQQQSITEEIKMVPPAISLTAFCAVGVCSMVYYQNPLLVQETFTKTARRGRCIKKDFVAKLHYVKGSKMIEVSSRWNRRCKEALLEALATLGMQSGDSVTSTLGIQQGNMEDTNNIDMEPGLTKINEVLPVEHGETFASGQDQDTNVLNLGVRSITDPLLNVPVPNSDLQHAPEIQVHYKNAPEDPTLFTDLEELVPLPMLPPSTNDHESEEAPEAGQEYLAYLEFAALEAPEDPTLFTLEELTTWMQ